MAFEHNPKKQTVGKNEAKKKKASGKTKNWKWVVEKDSLRSPHSYNLKGVHNILKIILRPSWDTQFGLGFTTGVNNQYTTPSTLSDQCTSNINQSSIQNIITNLIIPIKSSIDQ